MFVAPLSRNVTVARVSRGGGRGVNAGVRPPARTADCRASMHDARDAEDKRLLDEGEHKLLVAAYFHPVRERCVLRLRNRDAADEAAQLVFVRPLAELGKGKRYDVPFRVVVWMVTEWTLRGFYAGAKEDAALPEDWELAAPDAYADWERDHDLGVLFAELPGR